MANAVLTDERSIHLGERTEYRLYVFALYPVFLIAALVGLLLPKRRRKKVYGTIFHEAADMAHSVIPWVFSGR